MRMPALTGNLGLKLISLILAIVLYWALRPDTSRHEEKNDPHLIQSR